MHKAPSQLSNNLFQYKHKFVKSDPKIGMSLCKALAALAYTRKDLTNQA